MQLSWVDWLVIVVYFLVNLAIGIYYCRRASTSMATMFGADTPLLVAGSSTWPCSALVRSSWRYCWACSCWWPLRLGLLHLLGPRTTGLGNFEPVEC